MKPTDEQIKEFWEGCGIFIVKDPLSYAWKWRDSNDNYHVGLPPIDLNNLFKYAVPRFKGVVAIDFIQKAQDKWYACVYDMSESGFDDMKEAHGETPALALFWAIYEVLKNGGV